MPRAKGTLTAKVKIGIKDDGKPAYKYITAHSKAELNRKKTAFLKEGTSAVKAVTLAEWIQQYIATYGVSFHTPQYYRYLSDALGNKPINRITEIDLQRLINAEEGRSYSFYEKYLLIIKQVFHKARKNHLITDDPAE